MPNFYTSAELGTSAADGFLWSNEETQSSFKLPGSMKWLHKFQITSFKTFLKVNTLMKDMFREPLQNLFILLFTGKRVDALLFLNGLSV